MNRPVTILVALTVAAQTATAGPSKSAPKRLPPRPTAVEFAQNA